VRWGIVHGEEVVDPTGQIDAGVLAYVTDDRFVVAEVCGAHCVVGSVEGSVTVVHSSPLTTAGEFKRLADHDPAARGTFWNIA
jgi:hypothetical protein